MLLKFDPNSLLLFIFLAVFNITITSCRSNAQNTACIQELEVKIKKIKKSDSLNIKALSCIKWDSLMIIAPEFSKNSVEKYGNISLPAVIDYNFYPDSEQGWWMIFLKKGKYVAHAKVNLYNFSFDDLMMNFPHQWDFFILPRKDCIFEFYTRKDYTFSNNGEEIRLAKLKK